MSTLIIILIVAHLIVGFGWAIYQLEGKKNKKKDAS